DATLQQIADPDDRDHDGISGRINMVWSHVAGRMAIGRFGWKSEQPSVRQQTAAAFIGDIGITTRLFPLENHTSGQSIAAPARSEQPDASDKVFDSVTAYARSLAVPAARTADDSLALRGR